MNKVVTITGYKPYELGVFAKDHPAIDFIKKALKKEILILLDGGLEWVLISGQLGVELWTAEIVIELQEDYPSLKLAILTPFLQQEEGWKEENKEYYQMIVEQADFVGSISNQPYINPSQFRNKNKIFLHKSECMVIVYDVQNEGTPKYIFEEAKRYQVNNKYEIRTIDFYDLQMIMEEEQWNAY